MAVDETRVFQYDKKELNRISRSFRAMDEEAQKAAKREVNALAAYAMDRIRAKAASLDDKVAVRIAQGGRVSATSKIGEIRFGFASQRFSGGADTAFNFGTRGGNGLGAGVEFGAYQDRLRTRSSGKYRGYNQFPRRTARFGVRGNEGRFIYPSLRESQKYIVATWEDAFFRILKEFDK
jgi:hypothetical protein